MSKEERKLHLVRTEPEPEVPEQQDDDDDEDGDEYSDMDQLERLESLREDMEELGVTTLDEVIERIAELNHKLDNH
ncbi:hypothetical protein ccbrp13_19040 [Ktedonobacteria bacterium brp13]|nr:hypothetical protein ccbrp13_19040 [Ktedonobacteria bacterium brp13]